MLSTTEIARIAIAEDHPMMRRSLEHVLRGMQEVKHCYSANNGQELLRYLQKTTKPPHLCILDLHMEPVDGYQAILEIKQKWPDIRNIIFTAYTAEPYVNKLIRAGADAFLSKGAEEEEIQTAIRTVLEEGKYYCDTFTKERAAKLTARYNHDVHLTKNEEKLLTWIGSELSYEQIGAKLYVSRRTVEGYRDSLCAKLKVNTRQELVAYAVSLGYVMVQSAFNPLMSGNQNDTGNC